MALYRQPGAATVGQSGTKLADLHKTPVPSNQSLSPLEPSRQVPLLPTRVGRLGHPSANAQDWDEVQIQNAFFTLKVSRAAGGAITYLSRAGSDRNVVNRWDTGRLIQQSYYGNDDGSSWAGEKWTWNPVQGGSFEGATGVLLDLKRKSDTEITTVSIPRNWAGGELLIEVVLESRIMLKDGFVMIKNRMYYSGWKNQVFRNHEIPATFLARTFSNVWSYDGNFPWTGSPMRQVTPIPTWEDKDKRPPVLDFRATEKWAAYEDIKTGEAVGLMSEAAVVFEFYRVGFDDFKGGPDDPWCSYMAPIAQFAINASSDYSYTAYLTLGRVPEIRKVFGQIHKFPPGNGGRGADDSYA
jgi:hypothetical protein